MKLALFFLSILTLFLFSNCAAIVAANNEMKVGVSSETSEADIKIDQTTYTKADGEVIQEIRKGELYLATASKDGYQSKSVVLAQSRISPIVLLNTLPAAFLWAVPPFAIGLAVGLTGIDMSISSSRKFPKHTTIPALVKLPERDSTEKYIWAFNMDVIINYGDTVMTIYKNRGKEKRDKPEELLTSNDYYDYSNVTLSEDVNKILESFGYSDKKSTILPNLWNSLYVNVTLSNVHHIFTKDSYYSGVFVVEATSKWDFLDGYGNVLYTCMVDQKSDPVLLKTSSDEQNFKKAMYNLLESSAIQAVKKKDILEQLKLQAPPPIKPTLISLAKGNTGNKSFKETLESVVQVKSGDFSASGTVISNDGHIITTYDILTHLKKIEIVIDDETYIAEIVSYNEKMNLSLIKINKADLVPISLIRNQYELRETVYSVSFSDIAYLKGYISKGSVAGIRKFESMNFIQTDVAMSPGNSGGILMNKNKEVVGILITQIRSIGVDGIGFAIPIKDVFEGLNIYFS